MGKEERKEDKDGLTTNNEVDIMEDCLSLLQLPGVSLVEHVVDAV